MALMRIWVLLVLFLPGWVPLWGDENFTVEAPVGEIRPDVPFEFIVRHDFPQGSMTLEIAEMRLVATSSFQILDSRQDSMDSVDDDRRVDEFRFRLKIHEVGEWSYPEISYRLAHGASEPLFLNRRFNGVLRVVAVPNLNIFFETPLLYQLKSQRNLMATPWLNLFAASFALLGVGLAVIYFWILRPAPPAMARPRAELEDRERLLTAELLKLEHLLDREEGDLLSTMERELMYSIQVLTGGTHHPTPLARFLNQLNQLDVPDETIIELKRLFTMLETLKRRGAGFPELERRNFRETTDRALALLVKKLP